MQYVRYIFLFLLPTLHLLSLDPDVDPSPIAIFEATPSAIVNNVNVITGTYQEVAQDLVIPGPEPLVIQRAYCSLDRKKGSLQRAWNFNHGGRFRLDRNSHSQSRLYGPFDALCIMTCSNSPEGKDLCVLSVDSDTLVDGFTNCAEGRISGRTNKKNRRMYCNDRKKVCWLHIGSGTKCHYEPDEDDSEGTYYLRHEIKANGNIIRYSYSHNNQLRKVETRSPHGVVFAWAKFIWPSKDAFAKDPKMTILASDGRKVDYHFLEVKNKGRDKDLSYYFLNLVWRPEAPRDCYVYDTQSTKIKEVIKRKGLPEGRYLDIEYFSTGSQQAGHKWIRVDREDGIFRRVKNLQSPVGTDQTPIITHRFEYNLDRHFTSVYDALNRLTVYHYSDRSLLTCIRKISSSLLARCENFYWGQEKSQLGRLLSRTISSCGPEKFREGIVGCKSYTYDHKGNVLKESLWGDLTGRGRSMIIVDPKTSHPIENGTDHYDVCYEYSQDGYNLVLKEMYPNGKNVSYQYQPKTDLMIAKLVRDQDHIVMREFHAYDANAVLIQTIRDDGHTEDPNNLTGVTERHITRIQPKADVPCLGLPEIVEEKCLDLKTHQEVLLKRMVNLYDAFGHLVEQKHYDGNGVHVYTLAWKYNQLGKVIWEQDALGQTIERRYDANGNKVFEKGPRHDYYKQFKYDFSNRLIQEEEIDTTGLRLSKTYRYDYVGNCTASIDYSGNTTQYVYNSFNQLIRMIQPAVITPAGQECPTTHYEYDILGNRTETIDPRGFKTTKKYNLRGQPVDIHYPDETRETFEYTLAGKLKKHTDRKGLTIQYTYDIFDRVLIVEQSAEGQLLTKKSYVYSTFHLQKEIDEAGLETSYHYDCAGRVSKKQSGQQLTTYVYDALGRQHQETQWLSVSDYLAKVQNYDLLNRLTEEYLTDHTQTIYHRIHYTYHPDGQQASTTTYGQSGAVTTTFQYNQRQQPILIKDAEGNHTVYTYHYGHRNELNQMVLQSVMTDCCGCLTMTTYDAIGRVRAVCKQDPMGAILQLTRNFYDLANNKTAVAETVFYEGKEERIDWSVASYDCMNRLEKEIDHGLTPQEKATSYTYNQYGQKAMIKKSDGNHLMHTYDKLGRLATFKAEDGSFHYEYHYSPKNLIKQVRDLKNEEVTVRTYDVHDRLVYEKLQNNLEVHYAYDLIGRPILMTLPDHSSVIYRYRGPYLAEVERLSPNKEIRYQHIYVERDELGNPTIEKMLQEAGLLCHTYDRLGRTVSIESKQWKENGLVYNGLHQLLSMDRCDAKGEIRYTYSYDYLDQLKEECGEQSNCYTYDSLYNQRSKDQEVRLIDEGHRILACGTSKFSYDRNGNRIQKIEGDQQTVYAYDALDRLISVKNGNQTVMYKYDAFNRRIKKQIKEQKIDYLYADQNEIGSVVNREMKELRILGTGKGAEIGAAIAIEINKNVYAPVHDHNGNVNCLLDHQGNVVEVYRYNAFGQREIYDGNGVKLDQALNPWCFSSKRYDPESGWIYFGRRYYDPQTSCWTTPDPIGKEGGPNLYAYVMNRPLTHVDLYGLVDFSGFFNQLFMQICHLFGQGLSCIGYECMPVPVAKDAFMFPGHILKGNDMNEYVPSWNETHSRNDSVGCWEDVRSADIYVNGIRTSNNEVKTRYTNISNMCNGHKTYHTYNAMHGLMSDLLEWLGQRLGIPTNSVDRLVQNVRERINELGGVGSAGRVNLWPHSQGGEITASLQRHLSKEELAMIDVKTYGSANLFHKGDFGSVTHYVSTRDWVPLMGSPIQYMQAKLGLHPEVVFLPSMEESFFDHSFEGKTYQTQHHKDIYGIR